MNTSSLPPADQAIEVSVAIVPQESGYFWSYTLLNSPPGVVVHPYDGTLYIPQELGSARIDYILNVEQSAPSIELVYANLNVQLHDGVTAQISGITIHHDVNRITLQFANQNPRRFGVYLIARDNGNPAQAIVSPDPQVTNDPNSQPPPVGR